MTGMRYTISFFVPCLNEEGNVGRAIDNIVSVMKKAGGSYEIIVVDDHSSDGSIAEVQQRSAQYPDANIHLIENRFRRGLGRNYFIAAQRAAGEHFMLVNGDAVEPPEAILEMARHRGEADIIVPFFRFGTKRPLGRRLLSRAFTAIVNKLGGHTLRYYNGPVMHRTENIRMWFAETAGFGYQAELLCRLMDEGATYKEVELPYQGDRDTGVSKALKFWNLVAVSNSLFHITMHRLQTQSIRRLTEEDEQAEKKVRGRKKKK